MSRRIEVELTSTRPDGTWTWRAAGAKQPKGELDGSLLYEGAQVGDVVKAEASFELEGITILQITPPKTKGASPIERLEIIGTSRDFEPVTSSLVPKSERPRGGPRDRDRGDRGDRGDPGPRPDRGRAGPGGGRGERGDRAGGPRPERGERGPRPERGERPARGERPPARAGGEKPAAPPKPKPKKLNPQNVHRSAVLDSLPPEQRPVAEQALKGGIPAVRQAIETQNAKARAEGQPEIKPEPLLALAEELLPRLKAAEWRDRAEAAAKDVDEIGLRDLRTVVAAADVARDDEARALASQLREALERRTTAQRDAWITEITSALDEGRVVRGLRVAARPPDPSSRVPAELAMRLGQMAGEAMTADIAPDRWAILLDAVAASPVRRSVKPAGFPAEPGEQLLQAAKQTSGRVPALAAMLGIEMPPPPGPPRAPRRPGSRPVPPKPAAAPAPPAEPAPVEPEAPAEVVEVVEIPDALEAEPREAEAPAEPAG